MRNANSDNINDISRHFVSYTQSKLRGKKRKGRYSEVKSSQLSWAGQYKKCVQYDFKFSSEYSDISLMVLGTWTLFCNGHSL